MSITRILETINIWPTISRATSPRVLLSTQRSYKPCATNIMLGYKLRHENLSSVTLTFKKFADNCFVAATAKLYSGQLLCTIRLPCATRTRWDAFLVIFFSFFEDRIQASLYPREIRPVINTAGYRNVLSKRNQYSRILFNLTW